MQYAGALPLDVVRDQDEWDLDRARDARPSLPEDRLIDSTGAEYRLVSAEASSAPNGGRLSLEPTGRRLDVRAVQAIVERDLTNMGARPDWLAAYLAEIADEHRIRAAILYVLNLHRPDGSEDPQGSQD